LHLPGTEATTVDRANQGHAKATVVRRGGWGDFPQEPAQHAHQYGVEEHPLLPATYGLQVYWGPFEWM
jgi:hypothetical protein